MKAMTSPLLACRKGEAEALIRYAATDEASAEPHSHVRLCSDETLWRGNQITFLFRTRRRCKMSSTASLMNEGETQQRKIETRHFLQARSPMQLYAADTQWSIGIRS
jgi:hypothetical protein